REGVTDEIRGDGRTTRPGLDDLLRALLVLHVHLRLEVVVDERALLEATWHFLPPPSALLAGLATADDELVARTVGLAGAAFRLTPRRDRVAPTGGRALTTTVRVVDGVHHDTTDRGAAALPAHTAGLAPVDVRLLGVADLADGGAAAHVDATDLTGGHTQRGVGAFLAEQLDAHARGTSQLGAAAGTQLHGVDGGTGRDVAKRQVVARLDVGGGAGLDRGALLDALGRQDVALLAVHVVQQRDVGGAVGDVLDVRDLGRDAVLVQATEVDDAVGTLVPAATVARGDAAVGVATTGLAQRAQQRLRGRGRGDLGEVRNGRPTPTGGCRLVLANCHEFFSAFWNPRRLRDRASEDLDGLAVGRDGHERALGVLALAVTEAGPLALALTVGGVDAGDLHTEDLLDGDLDLRLVGVRVHDEGVGAFLDESVGLLRDDRRQQDVAGVGDGGHLLSS